MPPQPSMAASSLSFLNASRFGVGDTESCPGGFLLAAFSSRFGERVRKTTRFLPAAVYTGFVVNFYGLKQRVTLLMRGMNKLNAFVLKLFGEVDGCVKIFGCILIRRFYDYLSKF